MLPDDGEPTTKGHCLSVSLQTFWPNGLTPVGRSASDESLIARCGQEGLMIMTTRKRHSPEQVVRKLTTADRPLAEGKDVAAVCRELGVSEPT